MQCCAGSSRTVAPRAATRWLGFWWLALALPRVALADAAETVTVLVEKAEAAFARADWTAVRTNLDKAEEAARKGDLGNDKWMARIQVHMGALQVEGSRNPGKGIEHFRRALKIDPQVKLTREIARPEVLRAFKNALIMHRASFVSAGGAESEPAPEPTRAVKPAEVSAPEPEPAAVVASGDAEVEATADEGKEVASAPLPAPERRPAAPPRKLRREDTGPEEPDLPASMPTPLHCPNPDEAPPRRHAVLRCVGEDGLQIARVLLYYRTPGKEEFSSVPARRTPKGWFVASAPSVAFTGNLMQYYFEARNASDKTIAENGRFESPNLMLVREGATPVAHDGMAVRISSGDDLVGEDVDPLAVSGGASAGRGDGSGYWVALGVGRGFGWHGKSTLEWYGMPVAAGSAPAGVMHLAPEFGWRFGRRWGVALQGRHQLISREGADDAVSGAPAVGANAVLVKGVHFVPVGKFSNFHLSAAVGGGEGFRLIVAPNAAVDRPSSDSVRGGPWLMGPGMGFDIAFAETVAVRLGLEGLVGLPGSALVLDLTLGMVVAL